LFETLPAGTAARCTVFRPQRYAASYWKRHHEAKEVETKEIMFCEKKLLDASVRQTILRMLENASSLARRGNKAVCHAYP